MENIKESNQIRKEIFNNVIARLKKEGLTLSEDDIKKIKFGFYSGTDKYLFKRKAEGRFIWVYMMWVWQQFDDSSIVFRNNLSKKLVNIGFISVFFCVIAWESCYFFAWYCTFYDSFGGRKVKIEESVDFLGGFESYRF